MGGSARVPRPPQARLASSLGVTSASSGFSVFDELLELDVLGEAEVSWPVISTRGESVVLDAGVSDEPDEHALRASSVEVDRAINVLFFTCFSVLCEASA